MTETNVIVRRRRIVDEKYASLWSELELMPGAGRDMIDAAYRTLSRRYHPDTGVEDQRAQQRLNEAYHRLRKLVEEQ